MDKQRYEIKPGMDFIITEIFFMTDHANEAGLCSVHPAISFEGMAIPVGTMISFPCSYDYWSVFAEGKAVCYQILGFLDTCDRAKTEEMLKKHIRTTVEQGGIRFK